MCSLCEIKMQSSEENCKQKVEFSLTLHLVTNMVWYLHWKHLISVSHIATELALQFCFTLYYITLVALHCTHCNALHCIAIHYNALDGVLYN